MVQQVTEELPREMSDLSQSESEAPASSTLRVPACDSCRARKIKCDRKAPCSSCKASHVICRTTKRNPEKKQRILVSGRYEREIGDVNGRLASLEKILQALVDNNQRAGTETSPTGALPSSLSTPRDSQQIEGALGFEGESSFGAHSKAAVMGLESGLHRSPYSGSIQHVSDAIATLRGLLNTNAGDDRPSLEDPESLHEVVHYPQLSKLALPPMDAVLRLLRHVKVHGHRFFYECPILSVQEITNLCQQIYFPAEPYTISTFLSVHVILFYLFRDLLPLDVEELNMARSEIASVVELCSENVEVTFKNLRLVMDATYENIQALSLCSILAMEISRPVLGRTLVTTACRMCQDAGYHRLPPYSKAPDVETTRKRLLFWFIYATDRGLALSFGRAPTLQKWDISVDRPRVPEELDGQWGRLYSGWMEYSDIQGDIYEQLYCVRAQSEPLEVKIAFARALADRLQQLRDDFNIEPTSVPYLAQFQDNILFTEIVTLSALTMVYRVMPPAPLPDNQPHHPLKPGDEALLAAREALLTAITAWDRLKQRTGNEWQMFVNFSLMWCPFIPYLVVFGNAIADRNRQDLELLERTVVTLQGGTPRSGLAKLEKACCVFSQSARIYLDHIDAAVAAQQQQQQQGLQVPDPSRPNISQNSHTTTMPFMGVASSTFGQPSSAAAAMTTTTLQPDPQSMDAILPDLPMSQQTWDGIFDEWDLGLGAENAREISSYFESLAGMGVGGAVHHHQPAMGQQGPFG